MWQYNMPIRSDELWHYGVKGSHWYEHQTGRWDERAKYAEGEREHDIKEIRSDIKNVHSRSASYQRQRMSERSLSRYNGLTSKQRSEVNKARKRQEKASKKYVKNLQDLDKRLNSSSWGGKSADVMPKHLIRNAALGWFFGGVVGLPVATYISYKKGSARDYANGSRIAYNASNVTLDEIERKYGLK